MVNVLTPRGRSSESIRFDWKLVFSTRVSFILKAFFHPTPRQMNCEIYIIKKLQIQIMHGIRLHHQCFSFTKFRCLTMLGIHVKIPHPDWLITLKVAKNVRVRTVCVVHAIISQNVCDVYFQENFIKKHCTVYNVHSVRYELNVWHEFSQKISWFLSCICQINGWIDRWIVLSFGKNKSNYVNSIGCPV